MPFNNDILVEGFEVPARGTQEAMAESMYRGSPDTRNARLRSKRQ
jgi:hypothetical protein